MQTEKLARHHKKLAYVGLVLAGPLFLAVTDPGRLPLLFIVLPFLWLFVALYVSIYFAYKWRWPDGSRRRRIIVAGVGAALPVLLLVFESIHQLTIKDFLLAIALVVFVSFYMSRADFIH